mmetsp:Transcript_68907/g.138540  ORF Transcript_68907/g.138540 Transcript_68907/m.138540 type:complete len:161 (+) Transcript_68907:26-508(+)|eukprot:CAMPEP_0171615880 /NCGR_PEP_ID=MMETSP0990-20121206/13140_1 /TAXON_ID=483369 /ORGANISM="non described non described, Strain CCMP2098" /LENGTH=160 /DNA_ID=CAMNT_0012180029 /DNA_START=14 /DNA_END=496 /DNA_ORIENTATION=-
MIFQRCLVVLSALVGVSSAFSHHRVSAALRTRTIVKEGLGPLEGLVNGEPGVGNYPPFGSLVRQGPVPFFTRLSDPAKYEKSVLNFMNEEKGCSRLDAQGNIDAFNANPNDWMVDRIRAKKTGIKSPYGTQNTDPKSIALTGVWVVLLSTLIARFISVQI